MHLVSVVEDGRQEHDYISILKEFCDQSGRVIGMLKAMPVLDFGVLLIEMVKFWELGLDAIRKRQRSKELCKPAKHWLRLCLGKVVIKVTSGSL